MNTTTDNHPIVAFDIETTGLDPDCGQVTSAAFYGEGLAVAFDDTSEARLLRSITGFLAELVDARLVTWNGAVFDFPFLHARYQANGADAPFNLALNELIVPKYEPVNGYAGGYDVVFGAGPVRHADIAYGYYRRWAAEAGVTWSLKPVAKAYGIDMVEVDCEHMELLSPPQRLAYNVSDVVGTYELGVNADRQGQLGVL